MTPYTRKFLQTYICPPSCGISLHCPPWHRSHPAARQLWVGDQLSSYWGRSTRQSRCWWHWSPCRTAGRKWKHTSSYRCVQCLQGQRGEREGTGCEGLFGVERGEKPNNIRDGDVGWGENTAGQVGFSPSIAKNQILLTVQLLNMTHICFPPMAQIEL